MNLVSRVSRLRRMGSLLALAVLCLIAMLTLTRCKLATDAVVGLEDSRHRSPVRRCISNCNEQYEDALDEEKRLHKRNLRACELDDDDDDDGDNDDDDGDGDDEDDDRIADETARRAVPGGKAGVAITRAADDDDDDYDPACYAAEKARHKAAKDQIRADRTACIGACHHQGGGSGGR